MQGWVIPRFSVFEVSHSGLNVAAAVMASAEWLRIIGTIDLSSILKIYPNIAYKKQNVCFNKKLKTMHMLDILFF